MTAGRTYWVKDRETVVLPRLVAIVLSQTHTVRGGHRLCNDRQVVGDTVALVPYR